MESRVRGRDEWMCGRAASEGQLAACQRGRWVTERTCGRASGRGAPCPSATCHVLPPADGRTSGERHHEQSGPVSERGMRAGMGDGRVRDAPRARGLRGLQLWGGSKACARCRAGWGVGMRSGRGRSAWWGCFFDPGGYFLCRSHERPGLESI